MTFNSRVKVYTGAGPTWQVHAAQAIRMVKEGSATRLNRKSIALVVTTNRECGRTNTGQTYTWQETIIGGMPPIVQHKPIYPEDLHLFRLAILENLVH